MGQKLKCYCVLHWYGLLAMLTMQLLLLLLPMHGPVTISGMHCAGPGEVEGYSSWQVEGPTDCCQGGESGPAERAAGELPLFGKTMCLTIICMLYCACPLHILYHSGQ